MATLLTVQQVAEQLQVSPGYVRDHANGRAKSDRIPAIKLGKLLRFHPEDITAYVERRRRNSGEIAGGLK